MSADDNQGFDPLDTTILGPGPDGSDSIGPTDFAGNRPGTDWGTGDLAQDQTGQAPISVRRPTQRGDWQGMVRAIVADLTPAVGLRYRAWAKRHEQLIVDMTHSQAFALYVEIATLRDTLADDQRPEDEREYDWLELHLAGLRPLIEAEMQAKRAEIADGVRESYLARVHALLEQGLISEEVSQIMMAGVSNG